MLILTTPLKQRYVKYWRMMKYWQMNQPASSVYRGLWCKLGPLCLCGHGMLTQCQVLVFMCAYTRPLHVHVYDSACREKAWDTQGVPNVLMGLDNRVSRISTGLIPNPQQAVQLYTDWLTPSHLAVTLLQTTSEGTSRINLLLQDTLCWLDQLQEGRRPILAIAWQSHQPSDNQVFGNKGSSNIYT